MRRREFLMTGLLQRQAAGAGLEEAHFPSRLHQFVWRNWELAEAGRMAQVLGCGETSVLAVGASLGLPAKRRLTEDQLARIYITVIRQNWFLLPEEQLIELLGWTRERYLFTLKEDDFLDIKLGVVKPPCEMLRYHEPTADERARAAEIKRVVTPLVRERGEELFDFVKALSKPPARRPWRAGSTGKVVWEPRFVYSHFALYGDPLLEPERDPFPDGYLERLAQCGVNGVWMQAVLNTMAPAKAFPEFGAKCETRLRNLRALVERAARHGVKVYLYLNEPRAMPEAFFAKRPEMRGVPHQGLVAMCTSSPVVREWLGDSLAHVFKAAPGLGGVFSITMSENHTNCFSHGGTWGDKAPTAAACPRCSKRTGAETVAELLTAFRDGVRRSSKNAAVMAWDWGWPNEMTEALVPRMPKDVGLLSVSEWDAPVQHGPVKAKVGEYSISVPGPGPRALKNWERARAAGVTPLAKTAFNNTWEIAAVPYIPAAHLIAEHCEGLRKAGVRGVLASWTCGGYPSPNLEVAMSYAVEPQAGRERILLDAAEQRFGKAAAPGVVEAWRLFSAAFREYPYGVHPYLIPTQHGPANLLRLKATGQRLGMILFPHDGLKTWCGKYPPEVVRAQFAKMAEMWAKGLAAMEQAAPRAAVDLAVARTCQHHFESVANQVEFYMLRDGKTPGAGVRMRELAQAEMELAMRQYKVQRTCSVIGYEASNHYFYTPLDMIEKVLNCRAVMAALG